MTKHEIAALACKILAIYAVIIALGSLPVSLQFATSGFSSNVSRFSQLLQKPWTLVVALAPFILQTSSGVFLWMFADSIALAMVGETRIPPQISPQQTKLRSSDLQIVAFSVVGLLTLVEGISRISHIATNYLFVTTTGAASTRVYFRESMMATAATAVIQMIIGLWLLFGSRGLVRVLKSVRDVGLDHPNDESAGVSVEETSKVSNAQP